MEKKILEVLKEHQQQEGEGLLRKSQIRRRVVGQDESLKKAFSKALRAVISAGKVDKLEGGKYRLAAARKSIEGIISIAPNGCGFIKCDEYEATVFIPPSQTNLAASGDEVRVEITEEASSTEGKKGPVARVVEIITSNFTGAVGEYREIGGIPYLLPMKRGCPRIRLAVESVMSRDDLNEGDLIEVCEIQRDVADGEILGSISHHHGESGDLRTELNAIIKEFDLQRPYDEATETFASKLKIREIARRDLQDEVILTCDPRDAKDFDDALSVHPSDNPDEIVIGVHIADVAAYISPRGKLMEDIRARAFTSYLPGMMIPMLPKVLVSDRCSLIEGEKKPAHTLLITYNQKSGEVLKSERFHSWIKVRKRLNYDEVQEQAEKKFEGCTWDAEVIETARTLYDFSLKVRQFRKFKDQFIPIESTEVRVICDPVSMSLLGLKSEAHNEAHVMVEEFMLAANTAVAQELTEKAIPGMFRIHPSPDEEKAEMFAANMQAFFNMFPGDITERSNAVAFLKKMHGHPFAELISSEMLRSFQRALYTHQPAMHFGLGKGLYTHFTSPIRRLCDLSVHQQLWELESSGKVAHSSKSMELSAASITEKEFNVDEAYRTANVRFKLYLLNREIEEKGAIKVRALVSRITSKAMKAFLPEYGLPVNIFLDSFKDDYYETYLESGTMKGRKTGRVISCGMEIDCEIFAIDFIRKEAKVRPVLAEYSSRKGGKDRPAKGKSKHFVAPPTEEDSEDQPTEAEREHRAHRGKKSKSKGSKSKNRKAKAREAAAQSATAPKSESSDDEPGIVRKKNRHRDREQNAEERLEKQGRKKHRGGANIAARKNKQSKKKAASKKGSSSTKKG